MEKPSLTVVESRPTRPEPPRPLGKNGRGLWDRVQADYEITDTGGIELLAQACAALDRAEELAELIAREGPVIQTRTGCRANPAVKDELACRAFICRTIQRLGLNLEPVRPTLGRPPSWKPTA